MKKALFIGLVFLVTACSSKLIKPLAEDATRGAEEFAGLTLAELKEGRMLYKEKCSTCHDLKPLESKTVEGWKQIVPIMAKKGKVDAASETKILKYCVTMCTKVQ